MDSVTAHWIILATASALPLTRYLHTMRCLRCVETRGGSVGFSFCIFNLWVTRERACGGEDLEIRDTQGYCTIH